MKLFLRRLVVFGVCLVLASPALADKSYHVSTTGDDSNPGTAAAPFRTIQQAKQAVRVDVAAGLTENIFVIIAPGSYGVGETLEFTALDSGTANYKISYQALDPSNRPVITGGRLIGMGGWTRLNDTNVWRKQVDDVVNLNWKFRQLYNNAQLQIRSREPNVNLNDGLEYGAWELTTDPAYQGSGQGERTIEQSPFAEVEGISPSRTNITSSFKFPAVSASDHCEIVTLGPWSSTRASVAVANGRKITTNHRVGIDGVYYHDLVVKRDFFLEHALSFVNSENEWYLNYQTGELYYYDTGDPNTKNFWAPYVTTLISVQGTAPDANNNIQREPVVNLHFSHIRFQGAAGPSLPDDGYVGTQAHFSKNYLNQFSPAPPAAIQFRHVENTTFRHCQVRYCGSVGVAFDIGCQNSFIEFNEINDVGATGIVVGHFNDVNGEKFSLQNPNASSDLTVKFNKVYRYGQDLLGSVGIWGGFVPNLLISRNSVYDGFYTGISVGWEFSDATTRLSNPRVYHNEVYNVMKLYHDGSGIYGLGNWDGGEVNWNYVHNVWNGNGIQFDRGSSFISVKQNLVHDIGKHGLVLNPGHHRNVFNNIFAFVGELLLLSSQRNVYPDTSGVAYEFHRNIFYNSQRRSVMESFGPELMFVENSDFYDNLYFSTQQEDMVNMFTFEGENFFSWVTAFMMDVGSYDDENPGFINAEVGNFEFSDPAHVLGLIGFNDWFKTDAGAGW